MSGLRGRWQLASFDVAKADEHNRAVIDRVQCWAADVARWAEQARPIWTEGKPGLLLYGPPGVGKSWIAACAVNRLVDALVGARFLRGVDVPRNDQWAVEQLADDVATPVLVYDDVGAEKFTPRALECLYLILDGRTHAGAPTIITTNWRPEALGAMLNDAGAGYGDKVVSRLRELCEWVPVGGTDRRR